jgi:phenylalanyl-tRNA synthetase beta chain
MKISTQWLKDFVDLKPPLESLAERLTLAGLEVKKIFPAAEGKDILFEVEITTNRPDWLSHLGVAREIAAVENLSLKVPEPAKAAGRPMPPGWKLHLREQEGCPYYSGVYIEGVQPSATPDYIRDRLEACGIRSINLIVDITNYVLLEVGQPLHAFDADLLAGKEIQIRRARADESFRALDGSELKLNASDLVIADSDRVVALAGVMGGKDTEITARTRNIFLESAFFHPRWVRTTSQRHGLSSESSYRFERRVDPGGVDWGRERAVALIQKYGQPRFVGGVLKAGQTSAGSPKRIHLSLAEVEKRLGIPIKPSQASLILGRLSLDVKPDSAGSLSVGIPSFRADLARPIDLIEEIARIYGYDKIPETLPEYPPLKVQEDASDRLEEKARSFFSGIGAYETVTSSLIHPQGLDPDRDLRDAVSIVNPQNKELNLLRPTLSTSILSVIRHNSRWGINGAAFFEIANTYHQRPGQHHPAEDGTLAVALYGEWKEKTWMDPGRIAAFFDMKGMMDAFLGLCGLRGVCYEHGEKSYFEKFASEKITIESVPVGFLGQIRSGVLKVFDLDCPVFYAEISLPALLPFVRWRRLLEDLPRYPGIARDLSIMVRESVKTAAIEDEIIKHGGDLIRGVHLFDIFRGGRVTEGFKNLSFRVLYQSPEKTLLSDEIQGLHSRISQEVAAKFEAAFQSGD